MSSVEVIPFAEKHAVAAAVLLASMYEGVDGVHESYRTTLCDPSRLLTPSDGAIAAFCADRLVGVFVPSGARIRLECHAAAGDRRAVYRALYEAFAQRGGQRHHIAFATADEVGLQTFFELGFGIDQIRGVVPARGWSGVAGSADVGVAEKKDLDDLAALAWELQTFHTGAPMFGDLPLDEAATRRLVEADLRRTNGTVLKALDGTRIVGLAAVGAEGTYPANARIGMAIVTSDVRARAIGGSLVARAIDWAREAGYEWCEVGWTSANPVSDPFWRGLGFEPARYTLSRKVA